MSTDIDNLKQDVRQLDKRIEEMNGKIDKRFEEMTQFLKTVMETKKEVEKVSSKESRDAKALEQASVEFAQLAQTEQRTQEEQEEIKQEIKQEKREIGGIENAILKLDEYYANKNNQFENHWNEKLLQQNNLTKSTTTKDNYGGNTIHEITKNLSEIVFHENDTRIAACNKNYQDVAINFQPHLVIDRVGLKDNRDKLIPIQTELISKRVKFSDWQNHLFIYCKNEAVEYCYDNRGNIMNWTDCIMSFFQDVDFGEQNNRRLKELMNKHPTEGQNMREYCSELIYQAKYIRGMAVLPIILNKFDEALTQAESQIVAPQGNAVKKLQDLYAFIKLKIPANMVTKTTISTTPNLFEAQIKKRSPATVKASYFCNKCNCQKCKRLKYAKGAKSGFCFDCNCQYCTQKQRSYKTRNKWQVNSVASQPREITEEELPITSIKDSYDTQTYSDIELSESTPTDSEEDDRIELLEARPL